MVFERIWALGKLFPVVAGLGLATACQDPQEKARAVILEAGFRFTIEDYLKAAAEGRGAVVEQFLAAGMQINAAGSSGQTALRLAAGSGHAHLVRQLLEAGAAVDRADAAGITPLMAAAAAGDAAGVQALRAAGAQTGLVDSQGHNALEAAAAAGHAGVVDLLVPEGGNSPGEVLLLACAGGHTGVIDGLLKAGRAETQSQSDWTALLNAATAGGHLPAVRLLSSRMPETLEAGLARNEVLANAVTTGQPEIAAFLQDEVRRTSGIAAMAPVEDRPSKLPSEIPAREAMPESASLPSSAVPASPPARLGGARFTQVTSENMAQVPELMQMIAWEPQAWPVVLQDVAPEHQSADLLLTEDPPRTVTLRPGDAIPGTDCVVEKLRRRRLYTDATESVLKNVSELHFRRTSTGEVFKAMAGEPVLSNDSSAILRIKGVPRPYAAGPGDEFRLGNLLLRVVRIARNTLTLENRLTRETVEISLTSAP